MLPSEPQRSQAAGGESFGTAVVRFFSGWRSHPFLKIMGVFIALLLWVLQMLADTELKYEKVITDVSLSVVGATQLRDRGYTLAQNLNADALKVTMRVEVPWRNYTKVTGSMYSPRVDLSDAKLEAGQQFIQIRSTETKEYGRVLSVEPKEILVNVDNYKTISGIRVGVNFTGENPDSLWIKRPTLEPSTIIISGPASLVDQVRYAEVAIANEDISVDRESYSEKAKIRLIGAKNAVISDPLIRVTSDGVTAIDSVSVSYSVYPLKEIPINTTRATKGEPAHGYELTEVKLSSPTVKIAGPRAVINRITSAYIAEPMDITGMSKSDLKSVPLQLPAGLEYNSSSSVIVIPIIQPASHTHSFSGLPLEILNTPPGLEARCNPASLSVRVTGDYLEVEDLDVSRVHMYVDAQGLAAGVYDAQVLWYVDNVTRAEVEPAQLEVRLTLTEMKDEPADP